MKPRCRTAFTLVELLVVITIIGMLAALLLPAINHAREAARSAQCMNNQRNLGFAIQEFDSKRGYLPGYRQYLPLKPLVPDNNLNPIVVVGWQVMLWQYTDRP
ncbi:MAG TPA: type II secretion system protein, partial [Pirellulales bacterium]